MLIDLTNKLHELSVATILGGGMSLLLFFFTRIYQKMDSFQALHGFILALSKELKVDLVNKNFQASSVIFVEATRVFSALPEGASYVQIYTIVSSVWRRAVAGMELSQSDLSGELTKLDSIKKYLSKDLRPTIFVFTSEILMPSFCAAVLKRRKKIIDSFR